MNEASRWNKCFQVMREAALRWLLVHEGQIECRIPEECVIVAPLDDATIGMLALNDYTREFLKELERVAEDHGGATFMHAVLILLELERKHAEAAERGRTH